MTAHDPEGTPEAIEAAFEAAMADRDGNLAARLVHEHPVTLGKHMQRAWNMLAFGKDSTHLPTLTEMKEMNEAAAKRAVTHILEHHGLRESCDDFFRVWFDAAITQGSVHDRDAPWVAYRLIAAHALTPAEAEKVVVWAWTVCEFPEANLDAASWLTVFTIMKRLLGRVVTDVDLDDPEDALLAALPQTPLRLYRGAAAANASGMAWTADRGQAEWFARRYNGLVGRERNDGLAWETGKVYVADVHPDRVLARFVGRGEDEYVIDTRDLEISVASGRDHDSRGAS